MDMDMGVWNNQKYSLAYKRAERKPKPFPFSAGAFTFHTSGAKSDHSRVKGEGARMRGSFTGFRSPDKSLRSSPSAGGNSSFEKNSHSKAERVATSGRYHHFHGHLCLDNSCL